MRINRIKVKNFRNFKELDISLDKCAVIMGENRVGKSNLLFALRLVLDPALSDTNRQLSINDFWDGLERPLTDESILISVQLTDFEEDDDLLAILADYLVQPEPMIAELTYAFVKSVPDPEHPDIDTGYEFICYGGERIDNRFGYEVRKHIPIEVLHALRDVEGDLANWRKSPLRPLLERALKSIKADSAKNEAVKKIAERMDNVGSELSDIQDLSQLCKILNTNIESTAGPAQALTTSLGLAPSDPDKLLRALKLYIDEGNRDIAEASLGSANVLYLTLRSLEMDYLVSEGTRQHTFYAIEEPEAHLHPQLQRMVYRSFLQERNTTAPDNAEGEEIEESVSYFLTTHSPHIASVAPVKSFVFLRKTVEGSIGVSTSDLELDEAEEADIERYLDVTRAEALFAKGVILVEGDAERFLIPVLAKRAGYDLDALGIALCSVSGTNFTPYVKFFGPNGLSLPMAILTDLDPYTPKKKEGETEEPALQRHSDNRVINIKSALGHVPSPPGMPQDSNEELGIFLNNHTFETELYNKGSVHLMSHTMQELCSVEAAKDRFKARSDQTSNERAMPPLDDIKRFLKDIEYVGKGRFAQRLAWHISKCEAKYDLCPEYIIKGIKHVISLINK